jgi:hypothetical protein
MASGERVITFYGVTRLVGFGLDSLIEMTSGAALLWRLHQDKNTLRREEVERLTLRIVGSCFLLLSAYIGYVSLNSLVANKAPERSPFLPVERRRSPPLTAYPSYAIPSVCFPRVAATATSIPESGVLGIRVLAAVATLRNHW